MKRDLARLVPAVLITCGSTAALAQPANDSCLSAESISGNGVFTYDNTGATDDGIPGGCGLGGTMSTDVWFRWTPPAAGIYVISTCGNAVYDTVIAIYPEDGCTSGAVTTCADDQCGTQSSATVFSSGAPLLVRVSGYRDAFFGPGAVAIAEALPLVSIESTTYGKRYELLQTGGMSWTSIRENAATIGARIVSIESAEENEFVRTSVLGFDGADRRAWIGLTDEASEGTWMLANGEPATYFNWSGGEPSNGGASGLAEAYVEMFANGLWNDLQNTYVLTTHAIIEFPLGPSCLADVAGGGQAPGADGDLTADDIVVFIGWFFGSDTRADVAGGGQVIGADGDFTPDDIIVFINAFFAGC